MYSVGDRVKIIDVEIKKSMSHLIGKCFNIDYINKNVRRNYYIKSGNIRWCFNSQEIAPSTRLACLLYGTDTKHLEK